MTRHPLIPAFAVLAALVVAGSPSHAAMRGDARLAPPSPSTPQFLDIERRFDANDLDLWTTNFGWLAYDLSIGGPGLEFPRGSGKFALFASGLWVGAQVAGEKRVTVAEYSSEWGPGRILGGASEDHDAAGLQSWKVVPVASLATSNDTAFAAAPFGDPVRHHSWSAYVAEGGGVGAPIGTRRLPVFGNPTDSVDVPGPDLPGNLALWSVFNDADPFLHTNDAGFSTPLGLEVRQTVFGWASMLPGVAFVRWTLVHRGPAPLDSAYVGFWSDPDLGGLADDVVGWNEWHGLGYAYNAQNVDAVYGSNPPAVGFQYLGGSNGAPVAAFASAINGTDPTSAPESYNVLQGKMPTGDLWINPVSGLPTRFVYDGDPLSNQGWLDTNPADKRMTVSVGPFSLAPGDSATFTFAVLAAQGFNRLDSIHRLQCTATAARITYNQGFVPPTLPLGPECEFATTCPVPSSTWAEFCEDPKSLPPHTLDALANVVFSQTVSVPSPGIPEADFCAYMSAPEPLPAGVRAQRELLSLLANLNAPLFSGINGPTGIRVGIAGDTPVSCPWTTATTVAELAERAPDVTALQATYVEVDTENPRDFQPVDFGLEAYQGGVGFGSSFFGSSIDPFAHPDSFGTVDLRFDATSTQKAYRYLRLSLDDGFTPPLAGREYRYAGYHTVPVEAIDVVTGDRLELAFVEKAYVTDIGTLLPPFLQPATFDSTWGPSAEFDGDREYLFVIRRGDSGSPRPEMEVDDAIGGTTGVSNVPVLYAAALRRFAPDDFPEPGEMLVITPFTATPSPGADARIRELQALPQDDPATIAGYTEVADCLAAINAGQGLGTECDISTPTTIAIEESSVEGGVVRLTWYVAGDGAGPYDLARRRDDSEEWSPLGRLSVDGTRRVRYEDRNVAAGEHWSYALFDPRDPAQPIDVVDVTLPGAPAFALRIGVGRGGQLPTLAFSLPTAGEARLEMFDASGRRRYGSSLGTLAAGPHVKPWPAGAPSDAGLLFVRLTFAGNSVLGRAVVLR